MPFHRQRGFTLVELAIVLVIIGLLVGGVLAGQELIKTSRRRGIVREVNAYKTAVATFIGKYNALPGDMKNATQFWGTGTCPLPTWDSQQSPVGPTCDGNGDGIYTANTGGSNELVEFWQHLQNAGYITSAVTGAVPAQEGIIIRNVGSGSSARYPTAAPAAMPGNAWSLAINGYPWWPGTVSPNVHSVASQYYIEGSYGNALRLGCPDSDGGGCQRDTLGSGIQALDAYEIDTKLDDGLAGQGDVVVFEGRQYGWAPDCADNPDGSPAPRSDTAPMTGIVYDTRSAETYDCTLIFKNVF